MFESFNSTYECTGACLMWTCFQTNSDKHFTEKTELTNHKTPNKPNETKPNKQTNEERNAFTSICAFKIGRATRECVVYIYLLRIALGHLK